MVRNVKIGLLFFIFCFSMGVVFFSNAQQKYLSISVSSANIRQCPSLSCNSIAVLTRGVLLPSFESRFSESFVWYRVQYVPSLQFNPRYAYSFYGWVRSDVVIFTQSSRTPTANLSATPSVTLTKTPTSTLTSTSTFTPSFTPSRTFTITPTVTPAVNLTSSVNFRQIAVVNVSVANIRSCPSITCNFVRSVVSGNRLSVLNQNLDSKNNIWYNISFTPENQNSLLPNSGTVLGWIRSDLVNVITVFTTETPTVEPTPTAEFLLSNFFIPEFGLSAYVQIHGNYLLDYNGDIYKIYPFDAEFIRILGVQYVEVIPDFLYETWLFVCKTAQDLSGDCIRSFWLFVEN